MHVKKTTDAVRFTLGISALEHHTASARSAPRRCGSGFSRRAAPGRRPPLKCEMVAPLPCGQGQMPKSETHICSRSEDGRERGPGGRAQAHVNPGFVSLHAPPPYPSRYPSFHYPGRPLAQDGSAAFLHCALRPMSSGSLWMRPAPPYPEPLQSNTAFVKSSQLHLSPADAFPIPFVSIPRATLELKVSLTSRHLVASSLSPALASVHMCRVQLYTTCLFS